VIASLQKLDGPDHRYELMQHFSLTMANIKYYAGEYEIADKVNSRYLLSS
jgi:hypothetical protein